MVALLEGLKIDWTRMPTYNTVMSVAAGAGLLTLVALGRSLLRKEPFQADGWALGFAVPGAILAVTGAHMSLTWPLAAYFPFDNVIFGETSLAFGALLLAAAFYLWKRGAMLEAHEDPAALLAEAARPLAPFICGMGLALLAIACAGVAFKLFAAPAEEPISGAFADHPWIEAIAMSGLFALVGVGATLFPFTFGKTRFEPTPMQKVVGFAWVLSGLGFLLFGALNFFTHIGLIVHTM